MSVGKALACTFLNIFGVDSILLLVLKACVPVFVMTYYIILEKYDRSDLNTDNFVMYFVELVVFWHLFSRIMRSAFESSKKQYCNVGIFVLLLVALFIFKIV